MVTRLERTYPNVAARLASLGPERRSAVVRQLSQLAAARTGLGSPTAGTDLQAWADEIDSRGWSQDSAGGWRQDEANFARARAAFAIRDAAEFDVRIDAAADSVYESIAALGIDAVSEVIQR